MNKISNFIIRSNKLNNNGKNIYENYKMEKKLFAKEQKIKHIMMGVDVEIENNRDQTVASFSHKRYCCHNVVPLIDSISVFHFK